MKIRDAGTVRFTTRGKQRSFENTSSVMASRAINTEENKRMRGSQKDVQINLPKNPVASSYLFDCISEIRNSDSLGLYY